MIDTIIFDIGMVLVHFDYRGMIKRLGFDDSTSRKVISAMFEGPSWPECDRGTKSDEELLECFIQEEPSCEVQIRQAFEALGDTIKPYTYAVPWVKELKTKSYKIYYLSNFPRKTYELSKDQMSFLDYMDGGIFSFDVQSIKPESEIFLKLLSKYNLESHRCVFLDDSIHNIEAAKKLGFPSILFKDQQQGIEELKKLGIN